MQSQRLSQHITLLILLAIKDTLQLNTLRTDEPIASNDFIYEVSGQKQFNPKHLLVVKNISLDSTREAANILKAISDKYTTYCQKYDGYQNLSTQHLNLITVKHKTYSLMEANAYCWQQFFGKIIEIRSKKDFVNVLQLINISNVEFWANENLTTTLKHSCLLYTSDAADE